MFQLINFCHFLNFSSPGFLRTNFAEKQNEKRNLRCFFRTRPLCHSLCERVLSPPRPVTEAVTHTDGPASCSHSHWSRPPSYIFIYSFVLQVFRQVTVIFIYFQISEWLQCFLLSPWYYFVSLLYHSEKMCGAHNLGETWDCAGEHVTVFQILMGA